jgi:hypothetical protein
MLKATNSELPDRLSVSRPKKAPTRPFTTVELESLRRVADTLIPAGDGVISCGAVSDFENLATRAAGILDKSFSDLVATLADLSLVPQEELWTALESFSKEEPQKFYVLSTLVAGIYIYSDEIKEELNYPVPHRNPPDMFDVADELSSGILDPVIGGGYTYVATD